MKYQFVKIVKILKRIFAIMKTFLFEDILIPIVPIKNFRYIQKYFKKIKQLPTTTQNGASSSGKYIFWLCYLIFKYINFALILAMPNESEFTNLLTLNYFSLIQVPKEYIYISANIMFQLFYYYHLMHHYHAADNCFTRLPYEVLFKNNEKLFLKNIYAGKLICYQIKKFAIECLNVLQILVIVAGIFCFVLFN